MKINLPVTGQERLFPVDKTMVTKTDTKGIITFANLDFIELSGFEESELIGKSHNIIRHPDMPAVAFEIMWKTLQRGLPWQGIVKNRCKNGDHYWVNARVVPIRKNGKITGYMSVRSCPSRDEVANAEALYQVAASDPQAVRGEFPPEWKKHWSIKVGIPIWILVVTLMLIAGGMLGISGLATSRQGIQALQDEDMGPVQVLGRINTLMSDSRALVAMAMSHPSSGALPVSVDGLVSKDVQAMVRNKDEIDHLWDSYFRQVKDPTERDLAIAYDAARKRLGEELNLKIKPAVERGKFKEADQLFIHDIVPLYEKASMASDALLVYLTHRGRERVMELTEFNTLTINVAVCGILLCFLGLASGGIFFFKVTALPLEKAVVALEKIAEGNLTSPLENTGLGEPGRVMTAVLITQTHLKVMMHEMRKSSQSIREQCRSLNQIMMSLSEQSDEQHDRIYQLVENITASGREIEDVTEIVESMAHLTGEMPEPSPHTALTEPTASIGLEPAPDELLALFEDSGNPFMDEPANPQVPATPVPAETTGVVSEQNSFHRQIHGVVSAVRVQSFVVKDMSSQLKQVAGLVLKNRTDVQGAWMASQRLEKTANELDLMVKYFD